jgi:hypothetical protein
MTFPHRILPGLSFLITHAPMHTGSEPYPTNARAFWNRRIHGELSPQRASCGR